MKGALNETVAIQEIQDVVSQVNVQKLNYITVLSDCVVCVVDIFCYFFLQFCIFFLKMNLCHL